MGFQFRAKRKEPRFLRSNGTPSFSSRVYEKPSEVSVIARRPVVTATPTTPVFEALKTMAARGFRRLPITSPSGRLLGIITAMDFMDFFGGGKKFDIIVNRHKGRLYAALNEALEQIMTRDVVKSYLNETFVDVLAKMVKYNVGAIPIVTDDEKIFGIITEKDVVDHLAEKMTGKRVEEVMSSEVITIPPSTTLLEALKVMVSNGFRRLPVKGDRGVEGIIVAMDVVRFLGSTRIFEFIKSDSIYDVLNVGVQDLMTKSVVSISPESDIGEAADLMRKTNRGSLLVIEKGELVGIITERDLLIAIALE